MCPLMSQVGTWKIPVRCKSKKCFTMTVVKYSTSHPERLWDFPSSEMLKAGLNKSLSKLISVQLKVGLSCSRGASQPKLFLGPLTKLPDLLFTPLFLPPPPHCLAFSPTWLVLQEFGLPSYPETLRLWPSGFPSYSRGSCLLRLTSLLFSLETFLSQPLETEIGFLRQQVCGGNLWDFLCPGKGLAQPCHQMVVPWSWYTTNFLTFIMLLHFTWPTFLH